MNKYSSRMIVTFFRGTWRQYFRIIGFVLVDAEYKCALRDFFEYFIL